jgi:hypothetical protein
MTKSAACCGESWSKGMAARSKVRMLATFFHKFEFHPLID